MNKQQEHHVKVAKDSIERLANNIEYLNDENLKLWRALDKACERLAFASNVNSIGELGSFTFAEVNRSKDLWKAWAMEDE